MEGVVSLAMLAARAAKNHRASGGDPYWADVAALLHFDGTNGSTTFTDEKGNTWSAVTTGGQLSTAQAKFGASSLWSNSGGIKCTTLTLGGTSTPWTIEWWFYRAASGTPAATQFLIGQDGLHGVLFSSNPIYAMGFYSDVSGQPYRIYTGSYPAGGSWHFAVLQWDGTYTSMALDGSLVGTSTAQLQNTAGIYIGRSTSGQPYPDFIDEVRITKGVARYSGTFPVPTAPFPNHT